MYQKSEEVQYPNVPLMSNPTSRVGALTTSFTPTVTSCSSVYIQVSMAMEA